MRRQQASAVALSLGQMCCAVEGRCRRQMDTIWAALNMLWAERCQLRATFAFNCVDAAASTLLHNASHSRPWTALPHTHPG